MQLRRILFALAILIAGIGVLTVILFIQGRVALGVLGSAIIVGLVGWGARASSRASPDATAFPSGSPKPANAPPDGHVRFTLVVENLEPDRIAAVWSDLCQPGREPSEEFRLLFRNFTVVEGRRFRFQKGDPISTSALLASVLGAATGVTIKTSLEPAAERTPLWS